MWLTICSGPEEGRRIECRSGTLEIGRDPTCGLCLNDHAVSRRHAVLMLDQLDAGQVRDEGSHNGTFVNDVRLLGAVAVRGVERVQVGDTVIQLSRSDGAAMDSGASARASATSTASAGVPVLADGSRIGIAAQGDVVQHGHNVAGGNQYIYNQQLIRWRQMRRNAHRLLVFSIVLMLAGFGLFGSWIIRWDSTLFGSANRPNSTPVMPSPIPWIPLGAFLMFAGIVLLVTALMMRRTKEPVPAG